MILYTPMQLELVLAGLDQMQHYPERCVKVNGVLALVRNIGGQEELVQLLSTDPKDYLRPDLIPGTQVLVGN